MGVIRVWSGIHTLRAYGMLGLGCRIPLRRGVREYRFFHLPAGFYIPQFTTYSLGALACT